MAETQAAETDGETPAIETTDLTKRYGDVTDCRR